MPKTIIMDGKEYPYPVVGEDVYVHTSLYISHGADDFHGGLCRITKIETSKTGLEYNRLKVSVKERPGHAYNWFYLCDEQAELKEEFGKQRGYEDPDFSLQSNTGAL